MTTGVIKDKNQILVTNTPNFAGSENVRFKLTVDGHDRILVDSLSRSGLSSLGRVTILGDLDVQGYMTTVNTTNTEIQDNTIILNRKESGAGVSLITSGIEVERGSETNTSWLADDFHDWWGPYGAAGDIDGPFKTIGNISKIDVTTAGQTLVVNGTGAITVPYGLTAERPSAPTVGMIRYNTDRKKIEYYWNSVWSDFGVIDQNQDTYITAESPSPGSNDDILHFVVQNVEGMRISNHRLELLDNFELRAYAGAASEPGYTFRTDATSGMFLKSNNVLGFATCGSERLSISNTSLVLKQYASGFGGLEISRTGGNTAWVFDSGNNWWGPYGANFSASGPSKALGNINLIDITTSGQTLTVNGTGSVLLPKGSSAARPASSVDGMIRYNTDQKRFEGYGNGVWSGLGGVTDVNQDTYIVAESPSPGSNDDTLRFFVHATEGMKLYQSALAMGPGFQILADTGTAAAPGISFTNNPTTGIFNRNSSGLGFVTNGAERLSVTDNSMNVTIPTVFQNTVNINGAVTATSLNIVGGSDFSGALNMHNYQIFNTASILPNTNATYDLGSPTLKWKTLYSMTSTAVYADLAERYAADAVYQPGTLLVFGGDHEVTTTDIFMDTRVAGVVSTNPAYRMNSEAGTDETHPYIALRGRVPCLVTGRIRKGDLLVTSEIPGVATAVPNPATGSVFAKALANYDSAEVGVIEVVVV